MRIVEGGGHSHPRRSQQRLHKGFGDVAFSRKAKRVIIIRVSGFESLLRYRRESRESLGSGNRVRNR